MNPFRVSSAPAYTVYKLTLALGVALWLIGISAANVMVIAGGCISFIASGVAAIAGGRTLTGVTGDGWGRT